MKTSKKRELYNRSVNIRAVLDQSSNENLHVTTLPTESEVKLIENDYASIDKQSVSSWKKTQRIRNKNNAIKNRCKPGGSPSVDLRRIERYA